MRRRQRPGQRQAARAVLLPLHLDGYGVVDELPELPQQPIPNYVTPEGMAALESWADALKKERYELEDHDDESIVDSSKLAHVLRDLRFGVHYMYTNSSRVEGNISKRNHLGYAIMFSKKIEVIGNSSLSSTRGHNQ